MANTVNDVMNVIASPDYGIKNIAGTNQEILAILSGVHNSKNNIHAIVDDVRSLLQKLVETNTSKNKPIEIGNKSSKINHKNIQDILDETKGIRKAIDSLAKILLDKQGGVNMPAVAKLSNKASDKVAEAMIKDIEKQKKGGGMSALVDAFTKLKNISLKDIIFGNLKLKKITKLFKNAKEDLKIKEKDLNAIIKLINATPEMVKSLSKIGWRINRVIKNDTIKKLSDILIGEKSILTLSKTIEKNKKVFDNANKTVKSIKEIVSSLNKIMRKLVFASLWAKLASMGIKTIEVTLNKLIPLSKKLTENEKDFKNASKAAKKITVLIGNILATSIFLTIAAVTGMPAILGALVVSVLVNTLVPIAKKLSKSNRHMSKAVGSSLMLVAFTGIMIVTSLALSKIATMGIPALLGSLVVLGVVSISILTFKAINKAKKNILIGSIMMALMGMSLLLFGVALGKITKATENVSLKQIGMIASITVLLTGCVAIMGMPAVAPFIILGSLSMAVMSIGLLIFGTALGKIAKATENLKFKQVLIVSGSILSLGLAIASMAPLIAPISLGSIALGTMCSALYIFANTVSRLVKLNKIPVRLVYQTLESIRYIRNFFVNNPIERETIKTAKRYKRMLRPFGKTIEYLNTLRRMGGVPTKLVYMALNAMGAIASYYANNPIEKKVIQQARKYKRVMRPFGKTVEYLNTLKKMGGIPMKLVYQTLNAMGAIASYYVNNPIERKVIKEAKRYEMMMRPFGKTIGFLSKLKEMGGVPTKLVYQALNIISAVGEFYKSVGLAKYKNIINTNSIIKSFAKNIKHLKNGIEGYSKEHHNRTLIALKSLKEILKTLDKDSLNNKQISTARKNISLLARMASTLLNISKINPLDISVIGNSLTNALNGVHSVDISQVKAVTDMFNAFKGINKSENIINKFAESVKEFTEACKELTEAMNNNIDTINSDSSSDEDGSIFDKLKNKVKNFIGAGSDNNNIDGSVQQTDINGIRIINVDEIANTIAAKINGAISVDIPDTQVQLTINGSGGNEWIISKY